MLEADEIQIHTEITALTKSLYGYAPHTVTPLTSFNNDVYLLTFVDADLSNKVLKMAGRRHGAERAKIADRYLLREQRIVRMLSLRGFPVPAVEATQDDLPFPSRPFFLMPCLPGSTLGQLDEMGTAEQAASLWSRAGAFVAQLGQLSPAELPQEARELAWNLTLDTIVAALDTHALLISPFTTILDLARPLLARPPQFIHGDYAESQVVTDGSSFAVIDWETGGLGPLLGMLARFIALTREYERDPVRRDQHIAWTLAGYEHIAPLSQEKRQELHLWEMLSHLGDASWKLSYNEEHRHHAYEILQRVKRWIYL